MTHTPGPWIAEAAMYVGAEPGEHQIMGADPTYGRCRLANVSAIVSVSVQRDGKPVGEVWVRAGVPQSLEGTARAARSTQGLEDVEPYGDSRDTWCPDGLMDLDNETILAAVRALALAAWRRGRRK